jgi:DNA-directed RNA polymerase sigma subunit (sigma70/sigma32)
MLCEQMLFEQMPCEQNAMRLKESIMPSQHQPPQLERALAALETSEALVLRLRTGLVDGHRHSLLEVGEFLGATRTEARSLEWSGWQKLEAKARGDRESLVALRYLLGRTKSSYRNSTVLN